MIIDRAPVPGGVKWRKTAPAVVGGYPVFLLAMQATYAELPHN
jgi:hypothetical protein